MPYMDPRSAPVDRVMAALVPGLELEFGRGAGEALAQRFLEAEDVDFHWDARTNERWIGASFADDADGLDLDLVRIIGRIDRRWFVATMIVDGEGHAHGMTGRRVWPNARSAHTAFADD